MSSPASFGPWNGHGHAVQTPPPSSISNEATEDGITVKPMRLKVLYTFDDQNKTNCLARWPHVLQVQTVSMEEGSVIGVIELKTCIQAIVQCSPELVTRIGQDYTVYAYDYSEYDNPLVGQGMLSRVLHATSSLPEAPAEQSRQLITGRVCKNILGLFTNGVKETLEVKLRLVPVPTALQNEYQNTMEKYREASRNIPPPGYDVNEWNSLVQSTPSFGTNNPLPASQGQHPSPSMHQRDGISMELVNQLLSPSIQQQQLMESFNSQQTDQSFNAPSPMPTTTTPVPQDTSTGDINNKSKPGSRPESRTSIKRPRKTKQITPATGGNTSGYEEGTEGEEGPPTRKKRVKTTKANEWNAKSSFGTGGDLRMAASTAGSIRLFRPIAMSPAISAGSHLQEVPRAPTPVPRLPTAGSGQRLAKSNLRRDSFAREPSLPSSPYIPALQPDEDLRYSIESAGPSPERQDTPADTPPEFGSSPPVMRTRPPSTVRSSPPCPTSPCLPPMPRNDSGFMSGTIEELFGDDDGLGHVEEEEVPKPPKRVRNRGARAKPKPKPGDFQVEEPGPVELLPTHMPRPPPARPAKAAKPKKGVFIVGYPPVSRADSVNSEDGRQALPPMVPGHPQLMPRPSTPLELNGQQTQYGPPIAPSSPRKRGQSQLSQSALAPRPVQSYSAPPNKSTSRPPTPGQIPQAQSSQQVAPVAAMSAPNNTSTQPPNQSPLPDVSAPQEPKTVDATVQSLDSQPLPDSQPRASVDLTGTSQEPTDAAEKASTATLTLPQPPRRPSMPASVATAPVPDSQRTLSRTASMGSLTLPQVPASDPVLPPSHLYRSQTWSEVPHPMSEAPYPMYDGQNMYDVSAMQAPRGSFPLPDGSVPYSRTTNAKKAAIRHKLETAIANGEMPPYCRNCGAIETPAWRKAWAQEIQGAPGYYEYSDEPGRVTAIMVLTRDDAGAPTSYLLIKKSLKTNENISLFQEFILCNPCGIWMSKYKSQRPPERWESGKAIEKKVAEIAVRPQFQYQRPIKQPKIGSKNSEPHVTFDNNQVVGQPSADISSTQRQAEQPQLDARERSNSISNQKRLNAMTSDAASAALRRAIQSSPARWVGSRQSPIEVDVDEGDTTRRLLFPSPRKDGAVKVLGETVTNVVQITTTFHKDAVVDAPNKENCPPTIVEEEEDDFLRLFEEEMARPTTPVQKQAPQNPFKTPTRPASSHRPVTRSVSKSARKSPGHFLAVTPSRVTPRRSPRNHNNNGFISPFTATLNQMMSEANSHAQTSPVRHGMDMDFSTLPDLPLGGHHGNLENSFSLEDFFSTDVPMPSSPPGRSFRMYEDPIGALDMNDIDWNEFQNYGEGLDGGVSAEREGIENGNADEEGEVDVVIVKEEPEASPVKKSSLKKDEEAKAKEL